MTSQPSPKIQPLPEPIGKPLLVITNRQRKVPIDLKVCRRVLKNALPLCLANPGSDAPVLLDSLDEVSLSIVSAGVMAGIHQEFLGIDGATDVITFPYGEILICAEVAAGNARSYSVSAQDEVMLYAIHGMLHLHGYDDISPDSARRMRSRQANILKAAQI